MYGGRGPRFRNLRGQWLGLLQRLRFVGFWLRRGGSFLGLLAFRVARFGRILRNLGGLETHHADQLLLIVGLISGTPGEEHEQQQSRDRQRQADRKRAASHADVELVDVGCDWNRTRLKQGVSA